MLRFPPLVPLKTAIADWKATFSDELSKVCQENETVPTEKIPYKKAVLRHHNYDLSKRWYVEYYAWHEEQQQLVRIRAFEPLNRIKQIAKRIATGEEMVRIINRRLVQGKHIRATGPIDPVKPQLKTTTVTGAIDLFIEKKKAEGCRPSYLRDFQTLRNNYERWRHASRTNDFYFPTLHEQNLQEFFAWMKDNRGISARSFNNYRHTFSTFLSYMRKRYPRIVQKKLLRLVPVMRVKKSVRHAAFTSEQVRAICQRCRHHLYDQLLLMIYMIYYTLARPKELRLLRVQHLDFESNRIFIPGDISKNWNDEYINMAPALRVELLRQKINTFPKNFFVLGKNQQPGPEHPYGNTFWERNVKILNELDYTDRQYDLYSYKHSGAIDLYRSTRDIVLVQHTLRHSDIKQTSNYLRDLGVLDEDYFKLDGWSGALGAPGTSGKQEKVVRPK